MIELSLLGYFNIPKKIYIPQILEIQAALSQYQGVKLQRKQVISNMHNAVTSTVPGTAKY